MKYEKPKLINLNEHSMSSEGQTCSNGSGYLGNCSTGYTPRDFCTSGNNAISYSCNTGTNAGATCLGLGSSAIGTCQSGNYPSGTFCATGTGKV